MSENNNSSEHNSNDNNSDHIEKPAGQIIVADKKNSTLGLVSLITGIIALLTLSCCGPLSIILAITAIIVGIIAGREDQDYARIGIILGVLGLVTPLLLLLFIAGFSIFTPLLWIFR